MKLTKLLSATALSGVAIALAFPATAQVTAPAPGDATAKPTTAGPDDQTAANADGTDNTKEIVVTGSRIRRNEFNSAEPILILSREEATLAGFASTSEALQSTSITGGGDQINNSYSGFTNFNGGPGGNTLSLRGLGATRTLVLLNGRRLAPAGATGFVGSTDLNVLPAAIVDRIEVLKAGASSIYGSDAVAGVVNIITEKNLKGLTLSAQNNFTQHGGAETGRLAVVAGWSNDRFSASGSFEYFRQEPLTLGQRDWSVCQTQYRRTATNRTPGSGDLIDPLTGQSKCYPTGNTGESGVTVNTIGTSAVSGRTAALAPGVPAGYTGTCNRFRPNAAAGGAIPGYECVGGGTLGLNIRDTFDQRILNNQLISPTTNYTGFAQASYKLDALGQAEIYSELLVTRRDSSQLGFRQFTIDYPKGSPLIPAGLAFSTLGAAGTSTANPTSAIGVRVFAGYGNYESRQEVDYIKPSIGIRGDLFDRFHYDAYVSQSWSNATYSTDLILTDRLGASLDVVRNADGSFSCRSGAAGCVAAPALTPALVGGNYPDAFFNYVVQPVTGHTYYRETTFTLNLDGKLIHLPAGDVQLAVGAEHRRASIDDEPSAQSRAGNLYNFASSQPTVGKDYVWEGYGEVEVPVLRDLSWMHDFTLNGSGRYTNYHSYGGEWTYKGGGTLAPVKWFTFRGSYGTSYRAPALYEQFLGASSGFLSQTTDPCYSYGAGYAPTDIRYRNCASEGLAPDFLQTNSVRTFAGGGSGTGLKAETSVNWSVGGVLNAKFGESGFGDLSFAADYFNVDVSNEVAQAGTGSIISLCYDDPGFRSPSGRGYCGLITRDPVTKALTVNNNYTNLSEQVVRGIDFNLRYSHTIGRGRFVLDVQATKYYEQSSKLFPTDPLTDYNGTLETPSWTGTLDATYRIGSVMFRYGLDYVQHTQSYDLYEEDPATSVYILDAPDYFVHSLSVQFNIEKAYQLTMGVRNLTDKNPPLISSGVNSRIGNADLYSGYDIYGRRFFVTATAHF